MSGAQMIGEAGELPRERLDARIGLLAATVFATATDVYVVAAILPAVANELTISNSVAGQLLTAYMITYAVSSPLLAALTANWRPRRLIVGCLLLFGLADGLCAIAPGFISLLAVRILAACSSATFTPAAFGMAVSLCPASRRGVGLAILSFGVIAAPIFGVPIGTWVAYHIGWRVTFLMDMGLVLLTATAVSIAGLPEGAAAPSPTLLARLVPLTNGKLLAAVLPSIIWGAANNAIFLYIAVLFGPQFGVDSIPMLFFFGGLGGLVGSYLGGWLTDRWGTTASILVWLCVNLLGFALLNLAGGSFAGAAVALFVLSCCAWALVPSQQSLLLALVPGHNTVVLSLNNSAAYVGMGTGAILGAVVLGHASAGALTYIASAVLIVAFLVWSSTSLLVRAAGGPESPEVQQGS
jgi:DHA1 family inner membrane transport protein